MFRPQRLTPRLERLEDRCTPATITVVSGNLFISNPSGPLTVTATATPGKFDVSDAGKVVTVSGVGSLISITGTSRADTINFKLAGNNYGGNLLFNTGNGNDTILINGGGGKLGGNLTALTGNGIDAVNLGNLTVGGNALFDLGLGGDNATFTGDQVGLTGLGTPVNYGGNVTILNADNIFSDLPISIGGDLAMLSSTDGFANSWRMGVNVAGNATFVGGGRADLVRLNEGGTISGNLTVKLGGGNDTYEQGSGIAVSGAFAVGGLATIDLGDGDNNFLIGKASTGTSVGGATFGGDLILRAGTGNNRYDLSSSALIGGSLSVTAGDGVNDLATQSIQATITQSASFNLGSGNNLITLGASSSVGGKLSLRTGGGNNTLTLLGAQTYLTNIRFGSGNDALVLNNAALVLNGIVDGGSGSNTLTQTLGTLAPTLTLFGF